VIDRVQTSMNCGPGRANLDIASCGAQTHINGARAIAG